MADSEEEAVDSDVVAFLVGLALALHEVSTLHAVLAEESESVVLVENLDLLVLLHALAHHVRCTQVRLAHNHVHLLAETSQIESLLARCVAAAHYGNGALAVEEAVACGTCAHALSVVLLLVVESEIFGTCSGSDDHGVSLNLHARVSCEHVRLLREVDLCD